MFRLNYHCTIASSCIVICNTSSILDEITHVDGINVNQPQLPFTELLQPLFWTLKDGPVVIKGLFIWRSHVTVLLWDKTRSFWEIHCKFSHDRGREWVSKRTNEWAQRSAWVKWAMRSKRLSERCGGTSKRTNHSNSDHVPNHVYHPSPLNHPHFTLKSSQLTANEWPD